MAGEENPRDRWAYLVGSFVLSISDAELVTASVWQRVEPDKKCERNLGDRIVALRSHPALHDHRHSRLRELLGVYVEDRGLLTHRRAIAHYPLMLLAWRDIDRSLRVAGSIRHDGLKPEEEPIILNEEEMIALEGAARAASIELIEVARELGYWRTP